MSDAPLVMSAEVFLYQHQQCGHVLYQDHCHHDNCESTMAIAWKEIPDQRRHDHFQTPETHGGNGKRLGKSSTTMLTRLISRALPTHPSLQMQPEHKR
eukprot:CAMPEP_0168218522 /NCGR_PEP_ID=MMETSP0140_2-20121125/7962_1 /TAXON_ID=44445 /ORGANISM="Pseudo-nitzschia australis, Strain 10249 10 AB" /LENGTH=97 /DNA_ID=CAMNT_0008146623 /DNA_START=175 /DNA_END=465 /DNA_ORIENTATION=-